MSKVTVAATQMIGGWNVQENIDRADRLVRNACQQGAQIVLLQELFERNYFCQKQKPEYLDFAVPVDQNPAVQHFSRVARDLQVVLPISIFERSGNCLYNSVVVLDADGESLGIYRKSHIPDGPGYSEKYYFTPGDTGFKVFQTRYAAIGVGIC
ncbi:MAG: nitrilase-related carbon-nitrogen hydrolase [Pirellulales bacterium]